MNADWEQLKTILWLRWRLTTNQWRRTKGVGPALAIITAVAGIIITVAAAVGGLLGGAFGLASARPEVIMLVWDILVAVFLFIWMVSLITELQRSEMIDLSRLLHLPVSLNGIFVINYLTSLFSLSVAVFLPAALGLSLGLLWSHGWRMALLPPLVLAFLFMVSAWIYHLRGWLMVLMVNPRRRRTVIVTLTMSLVLVAQLPNLFINVIWRPWTHKAAPPKLVAGPVPGSPTNGIVATNDSRATNPPSPTNQLAVVDAGTPPNPWAIYLRVHDYVPLLWLSKGAQGLADQRVWPAIWTTLGALAIGLAGMGRAYASTMRFYQGSESAGVAQPLTPAPVTGPPRRNFMERQIPVVPEEVAALSLAFFRSLSRAPEAKMAFLSNVIVIVVLGIMMISHPFPPPGDTAKLFIATGGALFSLLGPLQILCNQFGFDREGFRALVLLPVSRRRVLLGKNLALAPVVLALGFLLLLALTFMLHLTPLFVLAGLVQMAACYLVLCLVGNFASSLAPYRMAPGSLKPSKVPAKTMVLIFLTHLLFPVLMAPAFLAPALAFGVNHWLGWSMGLVDVAVSLLLLGLTALFYSICLNPLAGFLERREKEILLVVSQEVE